MLFVQEPPSLGDLAGSSKRDVRKALFEHFRSPPSKQGEIIDYQDFHQGVFSCSYPAPSGWLPHKM